MKKYYLLIAALLNTIAAFAQFSGSGTGTITDPYLIYNENQLAQLCNFLNQSNVYFKLQKDLDLSDWISENNPSQGWSPIGVESQPFKGVFLGNNHTLSGIFINRSSDKNIGFFGYLSGATISDLNIEVGDISGASNVGTLAGYAKSSTISNITITVGDISGTSNVGTLAGNTESSTISNITIQAGDISGTSNVGGLIGYCNASDISACKTIGNVEASSAASGGIVGKAFGNINISDSSIQGTITGTANVGGAVGEILAGSSVTLTKVFTNGNISNTGDYTGGIVAKAPVGCISSIENCSYHGDINGKNYVGGIVGSIISNKNQSQPKYSGYSSSSTTSTLRWGPSYGEIISGDMAYSTISNCCAIGNITATSYCGGLVGNDEQDISYTLVSTGASDSSGSLGNGNYDTLLFRDGVMASNYKYRYYSPTDKRNTVATKIQDSYYSGNISATNYVGGLVGYKVSGELSKCYSYSTVMGSSNVGGIIGYAKSVTYMKFIIKSNVAINSAVSGSENVGRIYGSCDDSVTIGATGSSEGNRALTQTSVMLCGVAQDVKDDLQNGSSVGPSMLRLKGNYVSWGWSFDDNWDILETECYPYKKFQAAPPVITSDLVSQETTISGNSMNGGTIYLFYKDRDVVSTECSDNQWSFTTEPLQSGAQVQLYAVADNLAPSYLTSTTVKYPGKGTEDDPYLIYTAADLQGASNSGYFKVMNDIDLTSWINENSPTKGWPAIGRNSTVATYINGDGHKVTGLWINTTDSYNGLFSNYSAGYIKNLIVEVAPGKSVKGADYTGILIGRMYNGRIINCTVTGDVEGTIHTGGVTGYADTAEISAVSFDGTVKSTSSNAMVGGIAGGTNNVEMASAIADVEISATGNTNYIGGIVGKATGGSISKSRANAKITAPGTNDRTGGLAGYSSAAVEAVS